MSTKVLCTNASLICELHDDGLFIHVFGGTDPEAVEALLQGCDVKSYSMPHDDHWVVGYLVYPRYVLDAMQSLLEVFDLVIQ